MTRLSAKPNRLDKNHLKRKEVSCLYENAWNSVSQTAGKKTFAQQSARQAKRD